MKSMLDAAAEGATPVPAADSDAAAITAESEQVRLERLKDTIRQHFPPESTPNRHLLDKAFADAEYHHRHQRRKSGEAYIFHPVRVAKMVAEAGLDVEAAIVALLHDLIEDTEVTKEVMGEQYGDWLAEMVDGLTKVVAGKEQARGNAGARPTAMATYRKLISSTLRDLRTVQVKLFDRLDNMRDLGYLSRASQRRISNETLNVYMPMAMRLGMQLIGDELTALAFRYLYPKRFKAHLAALKQRIREAQPRTQSICALLESYLADAEGLTYQVTPIYRQISDLVHEDTVPPQALRGFKVRVPSSAACYRALGALHMQCRVVPNSIKDYISNPRPNRYQALQSEIFIDGEPTSIEVVSEAMERVNASGILVGWQGSHEEMHKYYQSYLELLDHYEGNDLRMEDVLRHAQMESVQIVTPKGRLLTFPQGATVLDFAFAIHSDLGVHCDGAYMGGRRVSRFEELHDGEMVEVITRDVVAPTAPWLDHVRTTRAKLAIRRHLKAQSNARAQEVGRKLFEAEVRRLGLNLDTLLASEAFQAVLAQRGLTAAQLHQQIGMDKLPIRAFLLEHELVARRQIERLESAESSLLRRYVRPMFRAPDPVLKIQALSDGFIRTKLCCTPLSGDPIVGVQEGDGIAIHRTECPTLETVSPERLLNVGWDLSGELTGYRLEIGLRQDRPGLLYKVSKVMRDAKVNILDIDLERDARAGNATIRVELEPIPLKTFRTVVSRLRTIKDVQRIRLAEPGVDAKG